MPSALAQLYTNPRNRDDSHQIPSPGSHGKEVASLGFEYTSICVQSLHPCAKPALPGHPRTGSEKDDSVPRHKSLRQGWLISNFTPQGGSVLSLEQRPGVVPPTGNHWDESCSLGRADHGPQRQRHGLAKQIAAQLKLRKRTTFSKTRNRKLAKSRTDLVQEMASGRKSFCTVVQKLLHTLPLGPRLRTRVTGHQESPTLVLISCSPEAGLTGTEKQKGEQEREWLVADEAGRSLCGEHWALHLRQFVPRIPHNDPGTQRCHCACGTFSFPEMVTAIFLVPCALLEAGPSPIKRCRLFPIPLKLGGLVAALTREYGVSDAV